MEQLATIILRVQSRIIGLAAAAVLARGSEHGRRTRTHHGRTPGVPAQRARRRNATTRPGRPQVADHTRRRPHLILATAPPVASPPTAGSLLRRPGRLRRQPGLLAVSSPSRFPPLWTLSPSL